MSLFSLAMKVYNIAMNLLSLVERIHSLFNLKSSKRNKGLRISLNQLENYIKDKSDDRPIVWFHCASLGEFFQAEPIIEKYHTKGSHRILLSFYSPSGYEQRSDYTKVNHVFYLPTDTKANAKNLVQLIQPSIVVFAKYEFWFNYLQQLNKSKAKVVFVSSLFRKDHYLFKAPIKYISLPILRKIEAIFVQDKNSIIIGNNQGLENIIHAGDTRIDAILAKKNQVIEDEKIKSFCEGNRVLIIGSSWPQDDLVYQDYMVEQNDLKIIIAPHEIHENRIEELLKISPDNSIVYSQFNVADIDKKILIIDSIGLLSSLYQLADVVYIGGGFGSGIHNTLEPAVYGVPLIFGPKYHKFEEANYFVSHQLSKSINNSNEFNQAMAWANDGTTRIMVETGMNEFFENNKGGADVIFEYLTRI